MSDGSSRARPGFSRVLLPLAGGTIGALSGYVLSFGPGQPTPLALLLLVGLGTTLGAELGHRLHRRLQRRRQRRTLGM